MSDLLEVEITYPRGHCLIVDDSPTVRKIARRLLARLQFELDDAENGQIALDKCALRMPEAILLDWNMPIMGGIAFLRALRQLENGHLPRVVMCTTEAEVAHVHEAFDAGADEYIVKPFDADALQTRLGGVVARQ